MKVLLPTKLTPPPIPAGYVPRQQLLNRLDGALDYKLTLVSAQAGSGKTTLVSGWMQAIRKRGIAYGWLSLDSADNDPRRFLQYMIASLEEGGISIETDDPQSRLDSHGGTDHLLSGFIQDLEKYKKNILLILDDYHLIQNRDVHSVVEAILAHAPAWLHIILLTRSDPPLELARYRVSGQMLELRMEHLRFSNQEADLFLKKAADVSLTEDDIIALNDRTEGWIAGLQLAAISLRGRDDPSGFITAFAGSHRFVFDYLFEQVLDRQPEDVREFLLKTSILEQLSAPLCDEVMDAGGKSQEILNYLEKANLFLIPLDDERNWYRYHHLFSDLLKLVLNQVHPGVVQELHFRASNWYEDQGILPEALHHALAANDMDLAANLVSTNPLALIDHSELVPILTEMDSMLKDKPSSLGLRIAHAWGLVYTGQMERARMELAQVEQGLECLNQEEQGFMNGHLAAVRGYAAWALGETDEAVMYARQADQILPSREIAVRSLNLTTLGNTLSEMEEYLQAVEVLERALSLARQAGQSHVIMPAVTALAYALLGICRFRQARELCLEAIQLAEIAGKRLGEPLPAAASAYTFMARILEEWGEMEQSFQFGRKSVSMAEVWGQTDTIVLCLINFADVLMLNNNPAGAFLALKRAREVSRWVSPWFIYSVDLVEMRISLDVDDMAQAEHLANDMGEATPVWLKARLLIKQNRLDEAHALIHQVLSREGKTPTINSIRLRALLALIYFLQKDEARALAEIKKVLEVAEPENMMASFVREGIGMEKLMRLALSKSISKDFIHRILDVCETRRKPRQIISDEKLVEPLSERELEILRYLDGPLSTPEIADLLVVSANTVRTHIKNIYGKLDVHGRSRAVRRAKELGLIA